MLEKPFREILINVNVKSILLTLNRVISSDVQPLTSRAESLDNRYNRANDEKNATAQATTIAKPTPRVEPRFATRERKTPRRQGFDT